MKDGRLEYAMAGGGEGSFIGPIHRAAIRLDDLADLIDGCYSSKDDWREMLRRVEGRADFIAVCTPNDSHYAIAKAALEAGHDVFCEKPLSLTVPEAEDLGRTAEANGRLLAIPFTYTGFPMVKLARDLVASGELGGICKVVLEYLQGSFRKIDFSKPLDKRNSWKMDPKRSGPSCVVADIGVHAFELIEYTTGLEVETLLADLSSFAPGNRLDDDASILMRLEGGAKAAATVSKVATGEENGVRLRIYGEKASIFWDQEDPNRLTVKYPFGPEKTYKRAAPYIAAASAAAAACSRIPAGHAEGFIEAFANIYRGFCASVRDRKRRDWPGAREGIRAMKFVEAALASNAAGSAWKRLDGTDAPPAA